MASTSSTLSQSLRKIEYDVFLSFRGTDTRKTFVDHLYKELQQKGIRTFKDDEDLEKGQRIEKLLQVIKESRFAIVVFSKDYASAKWCLEEIATIMECQQKYGEEIVIPIFYDVEPSVVRNQTESFAESFKRHEEENTEKAKVERWKDALTKAGEISGYHLQNDFNGFEAKCVQTVVDEIFARVNKSILASTILQKNLVGLDSSVNHIGKLLRMEPDDVRFIGIWGMGGIGKTTIARIVLKKFSSQFEEVCFLADIRENQGKISELQKTLIETILKGQVFNISNVHDGIEVIRTRFKHKKVLIVLDDVDHVEQLWKLAGDDDWFGGGSRVIITTRDWGVLRSHGVDKKYIYEVPTLGKDEAIQLFRCYAFKKEPKTGVIKHCASIVHYCKGLPLALIVLGSTLCGLEAAQWESTSKELKGTPHDDINVKLKLSFDRLNFNIQKIFLHIACFFRHEKEEYVRDVLKSCDLEPINAMRTLIEKSLISVVNEKIEMHDLIQEMGWHIARQENPRSRVWEFTEVDDVFCGKMEPKHIECILASYNYGCQLHNNENFSRAFEALKILIVECSDKYDQYKWYDEVVEKDDNFEYLPNNLRWFDFPDYCFSSLPKSFHPSGMYNNPSQLVGVCLHSSSLENCWITKKLDKLTYLDLSSSIYLLETPDFNMMPNLKRLNLSDCKDLKEIHPSIGLLNKLVLLDLSGCKNIEELPSFIEVSLLKFLYLDKCEKLKRFPEIIADMWGVVELNLSFVGIQELPSSIQNLQGLTKLCLCLCEKLVCLSSVCKLRNLKVLELYSCPKLKSLPVDFLNLSKLEELHISFTLISRLPQNIGCLNSLEYLNLSGNKFVRLPQSFQQLCRLQYLDISHCDKLEELPQLQLPRFQYLDISHCYKLKELPEFPATIRELRADIGLVLTSNIAELATKYLKLYAVSFSGLIKDSLASRSKPEVHIKYIRILGSFLRNTTPFTATYHINEIWSYIKGLFQYQCHHSSKISIDLDPSWYNQNFVGFVVCCKFWSRSLEDRHKQIGVIAKLKKKAHKNNENQVLQIECVVHKKSLYSSNEAVCFVYIPFSSLWPDHQSETKKGGVTPNGYSIFEAEFFGFDISTDWGCSLLYKDNEFIFQIICKWRRGKSWDEAEWLIASPDGSRGMLLNGFLELESLHESEESDGKPSMEEGDESKLIEPSAAEAVIAEHNHSGPYGTELWEFTEIVDQDQCRMVSMSECSKAKATANFVPQHWQPNSGLLMINDVVGVNLEKVVPCICPSNDDSYIVLAASGKVSVFNIMTFEVTETITLLPSAPTFLAFDPHDNNIIVIGTEKSSIHIYDRVEKELNELEEHQKPITGLAFSTKLKLLVSADANAQLCSWNTRLWKKKRSVRIQLPAGEVCSGDTHVMFHVDQLHLLVTHETQLAIYDASKMERMDQWIPHGSFSAPISSATYSCNCQLIYASFKDGNIGVFDAHNLTPKCHIAPFAYLSQVILNRSESVYAIAIAAHPEYPNQLAIGLTDGSIKVMIEPLESQRKWGISPPVDIKILNDRTIFLMEWPCVWSTSLWKMRKSVPIQLPGGGEVPSGGDTRVMLHADQLDSLVTHETHETQLAIYDASKMELIHQCISHASLSARISFATYSCNSQLIYASFIDGNIGVLDADTLRLKCRIVPYDYLLHQLVLNGSEDVYPLVITAHPQEPNQFAVGLTDGSIEEIESDHNHIEQDCETTASHQELDSACIEEDYADELNKERSRVTELEDKNRQLEARNKELAVQLQLEKEKHELMTLLLQTYQAEAANSDLLQRYGTLLEKQQLEEYEAKESNAGHSVKVAISEQRDEEAPMIEDGSEEALFEEIPATTRPDPIIREQMQSDDYHTEEDCKTIASEQELEAAYFDLFLATKNLMEKYGALEKQQLEKYKKLERYATLEQLEEYVAKESNAWHSVKVAISEHNDSVNEEEEEKKEEEEEEEEDKQRKNARLDNKDKEDIINSGKQNKGKNEQNDWRGEILATNVFADYVFQRLGDDCKQLYNLLREVTMEYNMECIDVELDANIFHHTNVKCIFVMIEDIKALFTMNWLDVSIIQVFIMYLYRLCKESEVSSIAFMCPTQIAKANVDMNLKAVMKYLHDTMSKLQDKTFILAPYHQINHWLLLVICTSSRVVYVVDPMQCDGGLKIKPVLNMVFRTFTNQPGQRGVVWKNIKCPRQPGNSECGYYVMRYMYDICRKYFAKTLLDEAFQETEAYFDKEIDEIRNMWAKYFLNECV